MLSKLFLFLFVIKCISSVKSHQLALLEPKVENFDSFKLLEELKDFYNETECGGSLSEYLTGLKETQLWALQMLDSSAKIPDGILFGNQKDLGHFDECIQVQHPSKLFVGQHCLLNVDLKLFPDVQGPTEGADEDLRSMVMPTINNFGLCLPSTCKAKEIEFGLNFIFNVTSLSNVTKVSLSEDNCRTTEARKLTDSDWVVVGVLIAFGAIALISTFYDVYQQFYIKNKKPHPLLSSFSVYSNGKYLFQISENSSQLKALHGIRVFSMSWVVLCHAYMTVAGAPIVNFLDLVKIIQDDNHVVIVNGFLSVDSFFFLSGLLVCLVFFRDMSKKGYYDVPLGYIHRYIRLTPPYAIMMLIMGTVFLYIGDGPLWFNINEPTVEVCRKSWWSGLLYVQSFVEANSNCVSQSWYLSTDMQLYWLSPLVLYPMYIFPKFAPYFLSILTVVAAFATFTVVYVNNLGASLVITQTALQMDLEYVRFYSRASPYIIGIATGYIICGIQAKKIKLNLSPIVVCIGWLAATGLCLGSLYSIREFTDFQWTQVEVAFYVAFHRVMWGLGLAWITIACVTGYGGPVNGFLSCNIFQPLGKLSYSVFLTHGAVQLYRLGSLRTNFYAGDIELTWYFLGDLVIAHLVSIPLTLIFEIPFGNIDRYFFRNVAILPCPSRQKLSKKEGKKPDENNNNLKNVEEGEINEAFKNDTQ